MSFIGTLWKVPGKGGWTFVTVPPEHAPVMVGSWGRAPAVATVDGVTFSTSVWRDKKNGTVLPVPSKIRRGKGEGDPVEVTLTYPMPDRPDNNW